MGTRDALASSYRLLRAFGIDPLATAGSVRELGRFYRDYSALKRQLREQAEEQTSPAIGALAFGSLYPCLKDRTAQSGTASGHYFHQDLWVAQRVFAAAPARHIDVGSRVDGFVAHVATFREIEVLDIRPPPNQVKNIVFRQADLTQLAPEWDGSTASLSCLHALEHFGLGRYGDSLDVAGHVKGLRNLARMLRPGGVLYLSVPIGPSRIEFNAHRVLSVPDVLALVHDEFEVRRLVYVDDRGDFHADCSLSDARAKDSFGCRYGCGIFELAKRWLGA